MSRDPFVASPRPVLVSELVEEPAPEDEGEGDEVGGGCGHGPDPTD